MPVCALFSQADPIFCFFKVSHHHLDNCYLKVWVAQRIFLSFQQSLQCHVIFIYICSNIFRFLFCFAFSLESGWRWARLLIDDWQLVILISLISRRQLEWRGRLLSTLCQPERMTTRPFWTGRLKRRSCDFYTPRVRCKGRAANILDRKWKERRERTALCQTFSRIRKWRAAGKLFKVFKRTRVSSVGFCITRNGVLRSLKLTN